MKSRRKRIIRIISFLLGCSLMSMTVMFLCACNTDPQNLDTWYVNGFVIDGQEGYVRGIYNQEYINSEYMTISFNDGKVVFNKNGEKLKGTYTYKVQMGCVPGRYDDNQVIIHLENGVTYQGSAHQYWVGYSLELENEREKLYFSEFRDDYTFMPFSGVDADAYDALQNVIDHRVSFPEIVYSFRITCGEQEKIITDTQFADKAVENLSEQLAYDYGGSLHDEDLILANNFYKYTFQILRDSGEYFQLTFYYNSETDFFYENSVNWGNVCVSGKSKSLYKYIVEQFNAE